jgi:DNA-binding MarR family transcriptional regulator
VSYDASVPDVPPHPPHRPLGSRANFLLSQLGFYSAHRFAERLAPLGIQPNHFGLLMHLERDDGQSQQQLADAMGIHRKVMVGLLDDLESRGLAERRRHPADRRAHAIHLTGRARDLLPEARAIADALEEDLLAGIDEPERAALIALLQRLAHQTGNPPGVHPGLRRATT